MLNLKYPGMAEGYNPNKVNQQVNKPSGPKAHPKHIAALAAAKKIPRVRVEPVNEEFRHLLKHPNGMAFRDNGSIEWPLDRFTHRRIREGSIKIVEHIGAQGKREPVQEAQAVKAPPEKQEKPARREQPTSTTST